MSLIAKIHQAVVTGHLPENFSTKDIRQWVIDKNITKLDGSKYAESSIRSIGANSNLKNLPTSNKNIKVVKSKIVGGQTFYYFSDAE